MVRSCQRVLGGAGKVMEMRGGSKYLAPAAWSSTVAVLDEEMGGANLALGHARHGARSRTSAMVGGHVVLELLGVGA